MWIFDLTPHQLDVLRTLGSIAGGIGGFLSGVAVVYSRLAAKRSKQAVNQTATTQWVNGEQKIATVVDYAKRSVHAGEATRQEVADFYTEWARGTGRRRLPTTEITPLGEQAHHEH